MVEDDQNWSKLYCLTVHENDLKPEWMPPGTAKRVRVIEWLPRMGTDSRDYVSRVLGSGLAVPGATGDSLSGMIQTRLLGDVDLDEAEREVTTRLGSWRARSPGEPAPPLPPLSALPPAPPSPPLPPGPPFAPL